MRTSSKIAAILAAAVVCGCVGLGVGSREKQFGATDKIDSAESSQLEKAASQAAISVKATQETTSAPKETTTADMTEEPSEPTTEATAEKATTALKKPEIVKVKASGVNVEATSVSELKITWNAEEGRNYDVAWSTGAPFTENINFVFPENGVCYLTGLRADSEYDITVTPILEEDEEAQVIPASLKGRTQGVEVIQEYEYEVGWTGCFAGERASGLTAMPSSGAIYGSAVDSVTGTGIRRFENGDYCCAMGEWYGECNDRFLVELENGIQFTVRICDSKGWADDADADVDGDGVMDYRYDENGNLVREGDGIPDGRFHWFGYGIGKCIIEFIYDDYNLPSCVRSAGSWGNWNWNGLNLCSNVKCIQKINY